MDAFEDFLEKLLKEAQASADISEALAIHQTCLLYTSDAADE